MVVLIIMHYYFAILTKVYTSSPNCLSACKYTKAINKWLIKFSALTFLAYGMTDIFSSGFSSKLYLSIIFL